MNVTEKKCSRGRVDVAAGLVLLAGVGIGALVSPSTPDGEAPAAAEKLGGETTARAGSPDPVAPAAPGSILRADLAAKEGVASVKEVPVPSSAAFTAGGAARIAPAPPESAVVRQISPDFIPPEVMKRLQARRAEKEKELFEERRSTAGPPLPPVDTGAQPTGIVRPLGPERIIRGAHPDEIPVEAEKRLRSRLEDQYRGRR